MSQSTLGELLLVLTNYHETNTRYIEGYDAQYFNILVLLKSLIWPALD